MSNYEIKIKFQNDRGFKYHDLTASTIFEDSRRDCTHLNRSRDDMDIPPRKSKQLESTPIKRGISVSYYSVIYTLYKL